MPRTSPPPDTMLLALIERAARCCATRSPRSTELNAVLDELVRWSLPILRRRWRAYVSDAADCRTAVVDLWLTVLRTPTAKNPFADYLRHRADKCAAGLRPQRPERYFLGGRVSVAHQWLRAHLGRETLRICDAISKAMQRKTREYTPDGMRHTAARGQAADWIPMDAEIRKRVRHLGFDYRRFLLAELLESVGERVHIGPAHWQVEHVLIENHGRRVASGPAETYDPYAPDHGEPEAPTLATQSWIDPPARHGATALLRTVFYDLETPFPLSGKVVRAWILRWLKIS